MPNIPYLIEGSILIIALLIGLLIYRWNASKENTFSLVDALLGDDGKASLFKIGQAVALATSTFGFLVQVQQGKLTEMYFTTYMTIWATANVVKTIFAKEPTKEV